MSCCLEDAILDRLRSLTCTPIPAANHFLNLRKCTDCVPYLVLKVRRSSGLRTSEGVQVIHDVELNAYFKQDKESDAGSYRDLVEEAFLEQGCVQLGDCGCICRRGVFRSRIEASTGGLLRYSLTFSGSYSQSEVASVSESA